VANLVGNYCKAAVIMGILGASSMISCAMAQERIRLNPAYKAPTAEELSTINNDLFAEDFNQFLNAQPETEQFVQLKEPENRDTSYTLLDPDSQKSAPLLQLEHQYQSTQSLLFGISPNVISNSMGQGLFSSGAAGSQLILSLNPSQQETTAFNQPRKVELSIGSSFVNRPLDGNDPLIYNGLSSQRAYNLSFGLNYSGFNIGASISRDTTLYMPQLRGFDLGFGYSGESWSANFRVGEYSRNTEQLLIGSGFNLFENVSAYELGAAYRLFSNVNLTGRFTYYSYGLGSDIAPLDDVQSLIFGTNLSF